MTLLRRLLALFVREWMFQQNRRKFGEDEALQMEHVED